MLLARIAQATALLAHLRNGPAGAAAAAHAAQIIAANLSVPAVHPREAVAACAARLSAANSEPPLQHVHASSPPADRRHPA